MDSIDDHMLRNIKTLAKLGSCEKVLSQPKGTLPSVFNMDINVALDVKDLVDLSKEKVKLDKRLAACETKIASIKKKQDSADYATKVPDNVKEKNVQTIIENENEIVEVRKAMDQLAAAMA